MTLTPRRIIEITVIVLLVITIAFGAGRACAPQPPPVIDDTDTHRREAEIEAELQRARALEDERLAHIEEVHAEEIRTFDADELEEYRRHAAHGRGALAAWFKERSRGLLLDGGAR